LRFLLMQESLALRAIVVTRQFTYAVGRESVHLMGMPSRDRALTNELWSTTVQARQPTGKGDLLTNHYACRDTGRSTRRDRPEWRWKEAKDGRRLEDVLLFITADCRTARYL
jgi:hypothetical protein